MSLDLLREKCSKALLSIKSNFFKKIGQHNLGGVSENLVNIFEVFEKFGQHIWGSEENGLT